MPFSLLCPHLTPPWQKQTTFLRPMPFYRHESMHGGRGEPTCRECSNFRIQEEGSFAHTFRREVTDGDGGPLMMKLDLLRVTSSSGLLNIARIVTSSRLVTKPASPDWAMNTPKRRPWGCRASPPKPGGDNDQLIGGVENM